MNFIDSAFLWTRSQSFFYRFTLFTRFLLAAAFLPTGMVKLMGERFTLIGPEHPIGAFFEALYQTGLFWRFIGLTQIIAAILLLIPRWAHLGAAIFLPIIVNIFVVTVSLNFHGTPIITGLMLLAVIYLCMWDYHRFRPLLTVTPFKHAVPQPRLDPWEKFGFTIFACSLLAFFGMTRSLFSAQLGIACIITGTTAGLFTLGRFLWLMAGRGLSASTLPHVGPEISET